MIWVDGAHGYPVVAIDLVNAYRIAREGAYVLVDDLETVPRPAKKADKMYSSMASFEVLNEFARSELISDFTLFLKRVHPKYNVRRYTETLPWLLRCGLARDSSKEIGMFIKEHR